MTLTYDVAEQLDDKSVQLLFEAMLDTNISGNADMEGLTTGEVRKMYEGKPVNRILLDGEVIGVFYPMTVDRSLYFDWLLDRDTIYNRIGFIYIDLDHRNKGYASKVLNDHVQKFDAYAECCSENNLASDAMLKKSLTFHRRYYNRWRGEYYNVYLK